MCHACHTFLLLCNAMVDGLRPVSTRTMLLDKPCSPRGIAHSSVTTPVHAFAQTSISMHGPRVACHR